MILVLQNGAKTIIFFEKKKQSASYYCKMAFRVPLGTTDSKVRL